MNFAKLYTAHVKFMTHLVESAVNNGDSSYYHLSNIWLTGLINPKKPEMYEQYLNWFESGSTNNLKKLLYDWTDFDENDLFHFNTLCFIDLAKAKWKLYL